MKQDSRELLNYMDNIYNTSNISAKYKIPQFSEKTTEMVHAFFRKWHHVYCQWCTLKNSFHIDILREIPKSPDYNYIHYKIRSIIENKCQQNISFSIQRKHRIFRIHMCADKTMSIEELQRRMMWIFMWLAFVNDYVSPTCSNDVNIYMYFIPHKKNLPENEIIDQIHVNTAFTTGCQPKTNVHIFREEEWFRALVHESFHNLGLDFLGISPYIQQFEEKRIRNVFPVEMSELRFYETYCEMWAEILNNMVIVFLNDLPKGRLPLTRWTQQFKDMLCYEGMFSLWQCVKVLDHNNLTYSKIMNNPHYASQYKEKTQGFSYYVLKSILMVHVSQFLDFCANQQPQISLKFRLNKNTLTKYTDIILQYYDSDKMLHSVKIIEQKFKKTKKKLLRETLRMSLFEQDGA